MWIFKLNKEAMAWYTSEDKRNQQKIIKQAGLLANIY